LIAKIGRSIADTKAYHKKSGTSIRVAIGARADIRANFNKDTFRLSSMPLLLYRALSIYSKEVNK
jgi:hypothetical protein